MTYFHIKIKQAFIRTFKNDCKNTEKLQEKVSKIRNPFIRLLCHFQKQPVQSQQWKNILTHFSPIFHFYTPWKRQKIFSGGIEMEHWAKMW